MWCKIPIDFYVGQNADRLWCWAKRQPILMLGKTLTKSDVGQNTDRFCCGAKRRPILMWGKRTIYIDSEVWQNTYLLWGVAEHLSTLRWGKTPIDYDVGQNACGKYWFLRGVILSSELKKQRYVPRIMRQKWCTCELSVHKVAGCKVGSATENTHTKTPA